MSTETTRGPRSASVALAVVHRLPIDGLSLLVASYEDLFIPPVLRPVENWFRRLNDQLVDGLYDAFRLTVGLNAYIDASIYRVEIVGDNAVFYVGPFGDDPASACPLSAFCVAHSVHLQCVGRIPDVGKVSFCVSMQTQEYAVLCDYDDDDDDDDDIPSLRAMPLALS